MLPHQTKPAFKSLTIASALVAFVSSMLPAFGLQLAPDAVPELENIVTGVACLVAIYGRVRANTLIQK